MKRLFDTVCSLLGLLILAPFFVLIALLIKLDSRGSVFYRQQRVGRYGEDFGLLKFRTMSTGADKQGLLTVGARDNRVTRIGYYLRKSKVDELPQLINVLIGDMSLVGPRPEVRKYVDMYTEEQQAVLTIRPGITDNASIQYVDENELLAQAEDAESTYVQTIMPAKLRLNLEYLQEKSVWKDVRIILRTIAKIILR